MKRRSQSDHEPRTATETVGGLAGKKALTDGMVQRKPRSGAGDLPPVVSAPSAAANMTPRADESFVESIIGPVQRRGAGDMADGDVHDAASAGTAGATHELPHLERIQASFGRHDVTGVKAHSDDTAAAAASSMGASAFATGDHVAFAGAPDVHTAAHEAAHVVQQRSGVHLKGGIGEAGDLYEQQADAVADAVVRGESAEALLGPADATMRNPADPAVQRRAAPARGAKHEGGPVKGGLEEPGHKERGWIRPVAGGGGDAPHVGSVYFRTKEHVLESDELALFAQLARMYGGYARRGLTTPGEPMGLTGRVVGYADPRPSSRPDNDALSQLRAAIVGRELTKAFVRETRLSEGHFDFTRVAAGVAPDAPVVTDEIAEANLLAPFRRADIHIAGRIADPVADDSPPLSNGGAAVAPGTPAPPDYSSLVHGYDRWVEAARQGDADIINGVAAHINGHFQGHGAYLVNSIATFGIAPVKPPWWDGRAATISSSPYRSMGRSPTRNAQEERRAERAFKALLLFRDFKEYAYYAQEHHSTIGEYQRALQEPDQANADRLALPLGHIRFMAIELDKSSKEVFDLSR